MTADTDAAGELPDSIVEMLDQQRPETLQAILRHCDALLEEYELADEVEDRTYG